MHACAWVGLIPAALTVGFLLGFLLGVFLGAQLLSGFLLACGYLPDPAFAFDSVQALVRTLPGMWLLRFLHVNGATMVFVLMSCHWAKAFAVHSYAYPREYVWWTGCVMVALLMLAAFTGYVLVWGQISYWALTVITNLATAIPLVGFDLLTALWAGEVLNAYSLGRFYCVHFLVPFVL
jgi:quinol-cytochrome oxidoreductase complex cytochrome b subunit